MDCISPRLSWHTPCLYRRVVGSPRPSDCSAVPLQIPRHNDTLGCWVPPATVHGSRLQSLVPFPYHNCNAGCWVIPPVSVQGRSLQSLVPLPYHNRNAGLLGPPVTVQGCPLPSLVPFPYTIIVSPGCWVPSVTIQGCPLQSLDLYLQHEAP